MQTEDDGKGIPFVLPKPTKVSLIESGTTQDHFQLPIFTMHNDGAPSIEHELFKSFHWHNTVIPERMGSVPSSEWKPEWITDEKNADVRAILIEQIGIDKVMHLGTVVDSYKTYSDKWFELSEYELVDMSQLFVSLDYAPYLKMKNQTTGVIHLEGVSEECKTIIDALTFRTGIDFNNVKIGSIH